MLVTMPTLPSMSHNRLGNLLGNIKVDSTFSSSLVTRSTIIMHSPVTAYPPISNSMYPTQSYPPAGYPQVGYQPPENAGGYGNHGQATCPMPPWPATAGYPPVGLGYGYPPAMQPQQVERTNEFGALGAALVGGVLGGLLIGDLVSEGVAGYDAGFQDGSSDFGS